MSPGTWAELTTNNVNVLRDNGTDGTVFGFSNDAAWDPNSRKFFYVGNDHIDGNTAEALHFVIYSADTNSWQTMPPPPWSTAGTTDHGYDHHAVNSATGEIYRRARKEGRVFYRYNIPNNSWAALPSNSLMEYASCCGGVDYFPELGGLVLAQGGDVGGGRVFLFKNSTNQWEELARNLNMGSIHNLGVYNPVRKVMLFGGGDNGARKIYKLDASRTVTALRDAPVDLRINSSIVTADPASGDYLIFTSGKQFYRYDIVTDSWQVLTNASVPIWNPGSIGIADMVATPIPEYGVTMFARCVAGDCRVNLYKHSSSGTPPPTDSTPPSTPTGVTSSAVSSSQVNLSWTASTDNIGVTGYLVERCGGSACTSFSQIATPSGTSYSDTGLSASTTYSYRVRATDAGGNLSGYSSVASATTQSASPPPSGGSDFASRCAAPGAIRCVGFDNTAEIAGTYGNNTGILSGATTPAIDTSTKASGSGSLLFTIPSNSGADTSGSYFANFSSDLSVGFGENSEFYVQWRQRFSTEFLTTVYEGSNGFKQAAITTGDQPGKLYASCEALGVTLQNTNQRGFPQMYHSCTGSTSHGAYDPFEKLFFNDNLGRDDIKLQNARLSPYCTYLQGQTTPKTYFPTDGNCFAYFPNEWMTFQVRIKAGPRVNDEFTNSYVQMWLAREGQPSQLIFDWGPYNLSAGASSENQKYGKVWLLPYQTGKSSSQSHPAAYTWYDELIISRNKIADPTSGGTSDTTPPAVPQNLTAN
jgi:hypothetical protein